MRVSAGFAGKRVPTYPIYEQVAATIFRDLTVNADADVTFPIVPLSIASIFSCASDPVTDTLWPRLGSFEKRDRPDDERHPDGRESNIYRSEVR
jgi:hypothetical protein